MTSLSDNTHSFRSCLSIDIVSRKYRKGYAKFVWKNLTRDGGATLSGTLGLEGMIENTSSLMLEYLSNGFEEWSYLKDSLYFYP